MLVARLQTEQGIEQVEGIQQSNELAVRYDLLRTDTESIRGVMRDADLLPALGFLDKIHWAIIAFTEKNERDSFNAPAMACCSNPDKIIERGKRKVTKSSCH